MKILIYIVCYNAEKYIGSVLRRVPSLYRSNPDIKIMVSDDCSSDRTAEIAAQVCQELGYVNYEVFKTKINQGYGGNQKIGYNYACSHNYDYVILLHGDGQYAPEELDNFFKLFKDEPDIILGSRMLVKKNALKGKMPLARFISNIILTKIQNFLAQTDLSEFHSGYRAYSVKFLKEIPYELNSNGFDFDTDILLQAKFLGRKTKEFPVTTFYGQEKSSVKLISYGISILKTTFKFRMQQMGIGCSLKFRGSKQSVYQDKFGYKYSTHYYLLKIIKDYKAKKILEIGSGAGYLGEKLKNENIRLTGIDLYPPQNTFYQDFFCDNIEQFDWKKLSGDNFDLVCLMDVLEHLKDPEKLLLALRNNPKLENAIFIMSVPNVTFFTIRIGLLCGRFNYADRGILDINHSRLFTYNSFRNMLKECGFLVSKTLPVPPPFKLISKSFIAGIFTSMFSLLNKISPSLFSFQIIKVAKPVPVSTKLINGLVYKK